jgi:phosphoribosylaminoimidazole (AIR) synthetase
MVVVVAARDADRTAALLTQAGEQVFRIGGIVPRDHGAPGTVVV